MGIKKTSIVADDAEIETATVEEAPAPVDEGSIPYRVASREQCLALWDKFGSVAVKQLRDKTLGEIATILSEKGKST